MPSLYFIHIANDRHRLENLPLRPFQVENSKANEAVNKQNRPTFAQNKQWKGGNRTLEVKDWIHVFFERRAEIDRIYVVDFEVDKRIEDVEMKDKNCNKQNNENSPDYDH